MRVRTVFAVVVIFMLAIGGAYSAYVFTMSKKWLDSIQYDADAVPNSHIIRTDTSCNKLAIDSLDFRNKNETRGNSGVFRVKMILDGVVLRSAYGPKFCTTYARLHRTKQEIEYIKSLK